VLSSSCLAQVPGEMFTLAMEAKKTRDMGVVGSTSNILDFIASKVKCALDQPFADKLQVSDKLAHIPVSVPITGQPNTILGFSLN